MVGSIFAGLAEEVVESGVCFVWVLVGVEEEKGGDRGEVLGQAAQTFPRFVNVARGALVDLVKERLDGIAFLAAVEF